MKNLLSKKSKIGIIFTLIIFSVYYSCSNDKDEGYFDYDPDKLIELTRFFPDSGGISTKVIIEGANFGSDTAKVKVFFNEKEAYIVSVKGDKMYVLPPRLPGDLCKIKVQIGDKYAEGDNLFRYTAMRTVSTIAGLPNSADEFRPGSLSTTTFRSFRGLAVDDDNNLFFSLDGSSVGRLSLTENISEKVYGSVPTGGDLNDPALDPVTQKVIFPSNSYTYLLELNPLTLWTPRVRQLGNIDGNTVCRYKHSIAVHGNVGYIRAYAGQIIKFDLDTYEGTVIGMDKTTNVDAWGAAIDPLQPNKLYLSYANRHIIKVIDLNNVNDQEIVIGSEGVYGWRDGQGKDAELNNPRQICFDSEGYLYIADNNNHCIRQYDRAGMVSTIAGIPREAGYADGAPDEAKFRNPRAICVDKNGDIYVGEAGTNRTVRRIRLE